MVLNSSVQSKDFNLNKYKAKFRSIYLNYNLFNRPPVGRYDNGYLLNKLYHIFSTIIKNKIKCSFLLCLIDKNVNQIIVVL